MERIEQPINIDAFTPIQESYLTKEEAKAYKTEVDKAAKSYSEMMDYMTQVKEAEKTIATLMVALNTAKEEARQMFSLHKMCAMRSKEMKIGMLANVKKRMMAIPEHQEELEKAAMNMKIRKVEEVKTVGKYWKNVLNEVSQKTGMKMAEYNTICHRDGLIEKFQSSCKFWRAQTAGDVFFTKKEAELSSAWKMVKLCKKKMAEQNLIVERKALLDAMERHVPKGEMESEMVKKKMSLKEANHSIDTTVGREEGKTQRRKAKAAARMDARISEFTPLFRTRIDKVMNEGIQNFMMGDTNKEVQKILAEDLGTVMWDWFRVVGYGTDDVSKNQFVEITMIASIIEVVRFGEQMATTANYKRYQELRDSFMMLVLNAVNKSEKNTTKNWDEAFQSFDGMGGFMSEMFKVDKLGKVLEKMHVDVDLKNNVPVEVDISDKLKEGIEEGVNALKHMKVKVVLGKATQATADRATAVFEKIQESMDVFKKNIGNVFEAGSMAPVMMRAVEILLSFVLICWSIARCKDTKVRIALLGSWALAIGLGTASITGIISLVMMMKERAESSIRQGFVSEAGKEMSDKEVEGIFLPMLGVVKHMFGATNVEIKKLDQQRIKNFRSYLGLIKDSSSMIQFLYKGLNMGMEFLYEKLTGEPWLDGEFKIIIEQVKQWHKEVAEQLGTDYTVEVPIDADRAQRIIALMATGNELANVLIGMDIKGKFVTFFNAYNSMKPLLAVAHIALRANTGRTEPVWIHIFGLRHTGKSTFGEVMLAHAMNLIGKRYDFNSIHSRVIGSEYWEGYWGQFAVFYDDLFQHNEQVAMTEDALEFIRMVNNAAFGLNMASAELKGNRFFKSQVLVSTSNVGTWDSLGLQLADLTALKRRRTIVVQVAVLKENKTETKTGQPCMIVDGLDPSLWRLRLHHVITDAPISDWMTYDEFLPLVVEEIQKKQKAGASLTERLVLLQDEKFLTTAEKEKRDKLRETGVFRNVDRRMVSEMMKTSADPLSEKINGESIVTMAERERIEAKEELRESIRKFDKKVEDEAKLAMEKERLRVLKENIALDKELNAAMRKTDGCPNPLLAEGEKKLIENARVKLEESRLSLKGFMLKAKETMQKNKKEVIAVAIGVVGVLGASLAIGLAIAKAASKDDEDELESEALSDYKQDKSGVKEGKREKIKPKRATWTKGRMESQDGDDATKNIVNNVLMNNCCTVSCDTKDGETGSVKGVFLCGRTVMTVSHMMKHAMMPDSKLRIDTIKGKFELAPDDYEEFHTETDICILKIKNKKVPEFKNIVHLFVKEADLEMSPGEVTGLFLWDKIAPMVKQGTKGHYTGSLSYHIRETKDTYVKNADGIVVTLVSERGNCGGLYILYNDKIPRKIVGPHVSGDSKKGAGIIMTQESIEKVLTGEFDEMKSEMHTTNEIPVVALPETVKLLGTMRASRQPSRSELVESSIQDKVVVSQKAPARLRPFTDEETGEKKSPMNIALKKFDRPRNTFYDARFESVLKYMVDKQTCTVEARVWTEEEGLNGLKGAEYSKPVEVNTSPGYGPNAWVLMKPTGTKGKAFLVWIERKGSSDQVIHASEQLKAAYQEMIDGYVHNGPRKPMIMMDCLKDELRSLEKVRIGKTRLFSGAPFEHLLGCKRYLGAYLEHQMVNHRKGSCKMGINPHSAQDWKDLYIYLTTRCKSFLAGDLETCDASLPIILAEMYKRYIHAWYDKFSVEEVTKEDERIRAGLIDDAVVATHIAINTVYQVEGGNPSGWFGTTDFNGFAVEFCENFGALYWYEELEIGDKVEEQVMDELDHATFGDDGVTGVTPEAEYLTMPRMAQVYAMFGMKYTDFTKSGTMPDHYKIEEVEFLKRKFRVDGTWVFAPLREAEVWEFTNWVTLAGRSRAVATWEKTRGGVYEAFHLGEKFFEHYKKSVNVALNEEGIDPVVYSYTKRMLEYMSVPPEKKAKRRYGEINEDFTGMKSESGEIKESVMLDTTTAPKTVQALTAFIDNTVPPQEAVESVSDVSSVHDGTDPYDDQGVGKLLSRPYPVTDFEWSGSSARGTFLIKGTFPKLLTDILNVKARLNAFQYMRSPVRVSFRVNATENYYGALLIWWSPHFRGPTNTQNPVQNIYTASNGTNVILTPDAGGVVDFLIPYVGPRDYWNMKDATDGDAMGFFGAFYVFVMHPLSLQGSTSTPSITVSVYASFEGAELAGFGLRQTISFKNFDQDDFTMMKSESGVNVEAKEKSEKQVISRGSEKKITTKTWIQKILFSPVMKRGLGLFFDIGSLLAHTLMSKPTSVMAPQMVNRRTNSGFTLMSGLDACEKLAADPENSVAVDWKLFAQKKDYDLFANYVRCPGLILLGEFGTSVTKGTKIFSFGVSPMICFNEPIGVMPTREYYYRTHLANLASNFMWWRGSIDYLIDFFASSFTSCRVRVTWIPDPTFASAITNDVEGDTISMVVDIKGRTRVTMKIPYLREYPMILTGDLQSANAVPIENWLYHNGQFFVQVINPLQTSVNTGTVKVYYSVWVAGGSDFEVARPSTFNVAYTDVTDGSKPEDDFSSMKSEMGTKTTDCDMRAAFENDFAPIIKANARIAGGIINGERITRWSQYLKRYTAVELAVTENPHIVTPWNFPDYNTHTFYLALKTFWFHRGSLRIKNVVRTCTEPTLNIVATNLNYEEILIYAENNGMAMHNIGTGSNVMEVEVPFYNNENMICQAYYNRGELVDPPQVAFDYAPVNPVAYSMSNEYWYAVGDDFSMGWPQTPIVLALELAKKVKQKKTKVATDLRRKT